MTAALEWSPGGCCCGSGRFDIYAGSSSDFDSRVGTIVRYASIWPTTTTPSPFHSKSAIDRYLTPAGDVVSLTCYDEGAVLWCSEARNFKFLAAYDHSQLLFGNLRLTSIPNLSGIPEADVQLPLPTSYRWVASANSGSTMERALSVGSSLAIMTPETGFGFYMSQEQISGVYQASLVRVPHGAACPLISKTVVINPQELPNQPAGYTNFLRGKHVRIVEVASDGSMTDWGSLPTEKIEAQIHDLSVFEVDIPFLSDKQCFPDWWGESTHEYWQCVAPQESLVGAGIRQNEYTVASRSDHSAMPFIEFHVGPIINNGTHTSVTGAVKSLSESLTLVRNGGSGYTGAAYYGGWDAFDSCRGTWAGLLSYSTRPWSFSDKEIRQALYIDGQLAIEYPAATSSSGLPASVPEKLFTGDFYNPGGRLLGLGVPHVCFPHETLGSGYVALVQKVYSTPPNTSNLNGVLENPSKPFAIVIYQGTSKIWQSPLMQSLPMPFIAGSSDRWIYAVTPLQVLDSEMTGGAFSNRYTFPIPPFTPVPAARGWLIKHDGSEVIPAGRLTDNPVVMQECGYSFPPTVKRVADDISLPGNYSDIWEQRAT